MALNSFRYAIQQPDEGVGRYIEKERLIEDYTSLSLSLVKFPVEGIYHRLPLFNVAGDLALSLSLCRLLFYFWDLASVYSADAAPSNRFQFRDAHPL